jgi:hypothetical protein
MCPVEHSHLVVMDYLHVLQVNGEHSLLACGQGRQQPVPAVAPEASDCGSRVTCFRSREPSSATSAGQPLAMRVFLQYMVLLGGFVHFSRRKHLCLKADSRAPATSERNLQLQLHLGQLHRCS